MGTAGPRGCHHLVAARSEKAHPCRLPAIDGEKYCAKHIDHAARRVEQVTVSLHDYVQDAMRALGRVVVEGEKDADVIKAALGILDRTGHGPSQTVNVADSDDRLNELLRIRREVQDAP